MYVHATQTTLETFTIADGSDCKCGAGVRLRRVFCWEAFATIGAQRQTQRGKSTFENPKLKNNSKFKCALHSSVGCFIPSTIQTVPERDVIPRRQLVCKTVPEMAHFDCVINLLNVAEFEHGGSAVFEVFTLLG